MNSELVKKLCMITPEERELLGGNDLDRQLYTESRRFLIDSARLLKKGEMITLRPHTRFVNFPAHKHNYIEITYMARGETRHIINGHERITLRAGELLMMNQHAEHAIEAASENDLAVNMIVLPSFFDAVLQQIGHDNVLGSFLMDGLREQDSDIAYLYFQVADIQPVQLVMESMVHHLVYHVPNGRKINQISMSLLFLHLLNFSHLLHFHPTRRQAEGIAIAALREIEENYTSASLGAIAQRHGCTLSYLSRIIKRATGSTYAELLQKKRMEKAAALLQQTSLSVSEIMHAVGYQNSSHFYHLFEMTFGTSPNSYRKIRSLK